MLGTGRPSVSLTSDPPSKLWVNELHPTRRDLECEFDVCYEFIQGGELYFSSLEFCEWLSVVK